MNVKEMTTTALIETFMLNSHAWNDEEKTNLRNECRTELEKRFKKEFVIDEYDEITNMSEEEVRKTEAYKCAYKDIEEMDWSYTDISMNYCVLGDYFDEKDIVYDICESTMIPKPIVWLAMRDFKEKNPQYIDLAEKYVENGFNAIEEEDFDEWLDSL